MEGYGVWMIMKGDEARPNAIVDANAAAILDWDKRETHFIPKE
jgi:hypothetical protein